MQNFTISKQQAAFIHRSVESGHFCNAGDVMRAGLRVLQHQMRKDKRKLQNLRRMLKEGMDPRLRGD